MKTRFATPVFRWMLLLVCPAGLTAQQAYYVATNGTAPHDGASWVTAMTNVQAAIDAAVADDILYLAGHAFDLDAPLIWSNKNLTVMGGYAATNTAGIPGSRDPDAWPTIWQRDADASDEFRTLHIHGGNGSALDGVTIRNGHAPKTPNYQHGGGILIQSATNLAIRNCVIRDNWIDAGYSGRGAGMAAIDSTLTISNTIFTANFLKGNRNDRDYFGGGLYLTGGESSIRDSIFDANEIQGAGQRIGYGSGIFISGGTHFMNNVLLVGNRFSSLSGGHRGGGLAINAGTVTCGNLSVLHNHGSALHRITAGTLTVGASIVWGNMAAPEGIMAFEYSNVQGGAPAGAGNRSEDPLFDRGIYLASDSPCVNAGGITVAAAGLSGYTTRADGTPDSGTVDMGYHFKTGLDPAAADVYVRIGGSDANSGTGPGDGAAFRTVTHALSVARDGTRIHIGTGVFDRAGGEDFPLVMARFGLQLRGAGATQTILDAGGVSNRVISAHRVLGDGSIRDLTVTRGRSDAYFGLSYYAGGGILADNCALLIDRVHVVNNRLDAGYSGPGAGIAAVNGGTLTVRDSVIAHNFLKGNRNDHDYFGAGLYVAGLPSRIERTVVFDNTIEGAGQKIGFGAGIYLGSGTHELTNVLIASNRMSNLTSRYGVGLCSAATEAILDRVTVADNIGEEGIRRSSGTFLLRNSIVWNHQAELTAVTSGEIWHSIVKGYPAIPDQGVLNDDPLFADRLHYHLQSREGHYTGGWFSGGSWTTAALDSPGIDAGDPDDSWAGEPYPHAGRLNIGAYAGHATASKSPPLAVAVVSPIAVTPDTALLCAELLAPGGSGVEYRFYYGTHDGGTDAGAWERSPTSWMSAPDNGQLRAAVETLTTGIPYYYRIYARNAEGYSVWSPTAMRFTPEIMPPVLGGLSVSKPMGPWVTLHAEIISTGGDTPRVFIFWGKADEGTNVHAWDTVIDLGLTAGPIEATIATESGSNYWFTVMTSNVAGVVWADYARPFGYYHRLFVVDGADGRRTGYNWPDALPSIDAAFAACESGRTNIIHLKGGTNGGVFVARPTSFRWTRSHVRIFGGYEGTRTTGDGPRDPRIWPTVLTRYPDEPPIRILEITGVTNGVLDGVTVTGGHPDPWITYASGSGILVENSVNLLLRDVTVTNNLLDAQPTGSGSGSTYTGRGAGMALFNSRATVADSLIADNFLRGRRNDIDYHGAGLYVSGGEVAIERSRIVANRMEGAGLRTARGSGIALVNGGSHRVRNTLIAGNTMASFTTMQGQGVTAQDATTAVAIENVTVADNEREGIRQVAGTVGVTNAIIWGHSVADIAGTVALSHSCAGSGGNPGIDGNIDDDPLFVDSTTGNYRLRTQFGRPVDGQWVHDPLTSPAVDAGTNLAWMVAAEDLDGNPRLARGYPANQVIRADMGAYEAHPRPFGSILSIR